MEVTLLAAVWLHYSSKYFLLCSATEKNHTGLEQIHFWMKYPFKGAVAWLNVRVSRLTSIDGAFPAGSGVCSAGQVPTGRSGCDQITVRIAVYTASLSRSALLHLTLRNTAETKPLFYSTKSSQTQVEIPTLTALPLMNRLMVEKMPVSRFCILASSADRVCSTSECFLLVLAVRADGVALRCWDALRTLSLIVPIVTCKTGKDTNS